MSVPNVLDVNFSYFDVIPEISTASYIDSNLRCDDQSTDCDNYEYPEGTLSLEGYVEMEGASGEHLFQEEF